MGYVPQGLGLFPHLTAIENVAFAKTSYGPEESRDRASRLMQNLDCSGVKERS